MTYRIGIVGFGIAGGAAAALLARAGNSVTLVEQAPTLGPVGTGILLQFSGQYVLDRMNLLDTVTAVSEPLDGLWAQHANGRTLLRLHYADAFPNRCGYGVRRSVLFEALQHAVEDAGVEVRLGTPMDGYRISEEGVYVGGHARQEHGPFDFVIAADGARSSLRTQVDARHASIEYDYGAIWLQGKSQAVRGHLRQVVGGTRRLLGLLPTGDGICTLFWGLPVNTMPAVRERGIEAWKREVLAYSTLAEEALSEVVSFDQTAFTTYRRSSTRAVFNSHVICLGDSAHPMSPHLGQGANLALVDAYCFSSALAETDSFQSAVRLYVAGRGAAIAYYSMLSRILTPFFQSNYDVLAAGRNVALPIMSAIPPIRRELLLSMAGINRGIFRTDPLFNPLLGGVIAASESVS